MMPVQIKNTTLYSVSELSQMLHLTPTTVRSYLNKGKLRGKKAYGRWYFMLSVMVAEKGKAIVGFFLMLYPQTLCLTHWIKALIINKGAC